jgi:hypothetical protein
MFRRLYFTMTVLAIFALIGISTAMARHGCNNRYRGSHYSYQPSASYYQHSYYPSHYGYGHYGGHRSHYYGHHGNRGYYGHGGHGGVQLSFGF